MPTPYEFVATPSNKPNCCAALTSVRIYVSVDCDVVLLGDYALDGASQRYVWTSPCTSFLRICTAPFKQATLESVTKTSPLQRTYTEITERMTFTLRGVTAVPVLTAVYRTGSNGTLEYVQCRKSWVYQYEYIRTRTKNKILNLLSQWRICTASSQSSYHRRKNATRVLCIILEIWMTYLGRLSILKSNNNHLLVSKFFVALQSTCKVND